MYDTSSIKSIWKPSSESSNLTLQSALLQSQSHHIQKHLWICLSSAHKYRGCSCFRPLLCIFTPAQYSFSTHFVRFFHSSYLPIFHYLSEDSCLHFQMWLCCLRYCRDTAIVSQIPKYLWIRLISPRILWLFRFTSAALWVYISLVPSSLMQS